MVTYLNNSFAQRAGAAFAASGSVGVALDTATNTQSAKDASRVGSVLAPNGTAQQNQQPQQDKGLLGDIMGGLSNALNATQVPLNKVKDYVSAAIRSSDVHHKQATNAGEGLVGGLWTLGYLLPGLGFADPTFRHEFAVTEKNNSSLGRVAIEGITQDGNFSRLDDPTKQAEEDAYYSHGWQKWTSGTLDLGADIWLDPTVVGGKALGVARAARNTVKAADVAEAAGRSTAALTGGAKRVALTVDRAVDASERIRSAASEGATGGYAALARTRYAGQAADSGAIAYMMGRADTITDDVARVNLKRNVFYAGMGDRTAMKALQKTHDDLALELETLNGPNRLSAMQSVLADSRYSYLDQLRLSQDEDYIARVLGVHADEIQKTLDALKRTEAVATHGAGYETALKSASGVGELAHLTDTAGREFMSIGKTISRGSVLPPVHIVNPLGRHIPGVFSLTDQSSLQSFKASTDEFAQMFGGKVARDGTTIENVVGSLLDRYATVNTASEAAARAQRKAIVDDFNKIATEMLAKKYGGGSKAEEKMIRGLIEQVRTKRNASTAHLVERSYRAAPNGMGTSHQPEGVITWDSKQMRKEFAKPLDGTQLDDAVSIPSYKGIESVLQRTMKTGGLAGYLKRAKDGAWELTEAGLAVTNDLWKFASLFRLGYTVRTQVDSQARQIALLGPMAYLGNAIKGTSHWAYNQTKVPVAHVNAIKDKIAAQGALARLTDQWGDDAAKWSNDVASEAQRLNGIIDAPLPQVGKDAAMTKRRGTELGRYLGTGGRGAAYQNIDDVLRETDVVSARESIAGLMETERQGVLGTMRASGQYQNVIGANPHWEQAYADMVNRQVRNSSPLTAMLNGSTDSDIVRYYKSTPEGRAVWNELSKHYLNVDELVAAQRQQMDLLFPNQAIRDRVLSGNISPEDAKTIFASVGERPSVPAERLELAASNKLTKAFMDARSKFFKVFAEMPENTMVRHPFYAARKEKHLQDAIANLGGDWSKLTVKQYNDVAKRAGILARRDVTRYMFDTSQQSNMGHFLRFVSPFYGAWSDTMRKWSLIAGEVPWVVPMMQKAFMAPNAFFQTVDADGNHILSNGDVVDENGTVIRHSADPTEGSILVPIPEWSKNFLGGFFNPGRGDSVKVNKNTLNVIFQGDPFWLPGPGPLASIPANEIAKRAFPEAWDNANPLGATLRFLLPYGLDESSPLAQSAPMWVKNALTLGAGLVNGKPFEDDRFGQTYAMLLAEETQAERAGLRPQLSDSELQKVITNRTRNWFILRLMGSELPFSTQPTTRLDYYRQLYQSYQRKFGGDARQKFYDDHPEFFEAAISLSQNNSGLSATEDSWNEAKKYKDQIKANPEYGWMFAGAANVAPGFDAGVYTAEKVNGLRQTKDPNTALQDMMVSKGWFEYQKVNGAIQTKLQERKTNGGSASLSAKSNADLKNIRDQYIAQLKADNAQWANAFDSGSGGRQADTFLRTAAQAVADRPDLMQRSDFQALDEYLMVRRVYQQELDKRGLSSIDNKNAADLKKAWDEFVLGLVNADIGFQQMYNRGGLDRDNLSGAM